MLQRVYIIRHGETEWALAGRHTGRTDVALTPKGEAQAQTVGRRLAGVSFDYVFSSPRRRAQQTCDLAGLGARKQIDPELAEWDYGDYEGKKSAEILQLNPNWKLFRDGCPNGESPAQMTARVDRVMARIRALTGTIAIFSHGHFSRSFAIRWIGLPILEAKHLLLDTASFGILEYEHDKIDAPAIARWNEGCAATG